MRIAILLLCVTAFALAEVYDDIDKKFDVGELLQNDRLLASYIKCLTNKGPCTPEVKKVKDKLPEALATHCAKCSDRQKEIGKTLAREVRKKHPEMWAELKALYDPDGKHQKAFKEFLA